MTRKLTRIIPVSVLLIICLSGFGQSVIGYAQADSFLVLRFDENIEYSRAVATSNFQVSNNITLSRAIIDGHDTRTVVLISNELLTEESYTITIRNQSYISMPDEILPDTTISITLDSRPWYNLSTDKRKGISHRSYWSESYQRLVGYNTYIPDFIKQPADSIPVIYFLGGLGNTENNQYRMWIDVVTDAINKNRIPPTMIVFPNPMKDSWYTAENGVDVETMITGELIPHIDTCYPVYRSREGRWISGFSMGGFGSLYLGFKYPELFGSIASYSAARIPEILNADALRNNTSILLAGGEKDFYFLFNVIQVYDNLLELEIPVILRGLPLLEHSISDIFMAIGIDGIEMHWNSLDGFDRLPVVDAGPDQEVKFDGTGSLVLSGKIKDDRYMGYHTKHWWSVSNVSGSVDLHDSTALDCLVTFNNEGSYTFTLHGIDSSFHVTDSLEIVVTTHPSNKAPVISAGQDLCVKLPVSSIEISASIEDDGLPSGAIPSILWKVDPADGITISDNHAKNPVITEISEGFYTLMLNVDDSEFQAEDSLYITCFSSTDPLPEIYIPMNEGSGDIAYNLIGETGHLLLKDTYWVSGQDKRGGQLYFTEDRSVAAIPANTFPLAGETANHRTISLWFKINSNRSLPQVLYDEGNTKNGILLYKKGGFLYAVATLDGNRTELQTTFDFTKGWCHVALTLGSDKIKLYTNGNLVTEADFNSQGFVPNVEDVGIGSAVNTTAASVAGGEGYASQFFDGYIDELIIFSEELTYSEISKLSGTTGLISNTTILEVSVWPNPANEILYVSIPKEFRHQEILLQVFSMEGKEVIRWKTQEPGFQLHFSIGTLPGGLYLLRMKSDGVVQTARFIVE